MTEAEAKKIDAEIAHLNAGTAKLQVEISKLIEDTAKVRQERRWYPAVVGGGLVAAGVALARIFF